MTSPLPSVPAWFRPEWRQRVLKPTSGNINITYMNYLKYLAPLGWLPHPSFGPEEKAYSLPDGYRTLVAASPVLSRAPVTLYLQAQQDRSKSPITYIDFDDFICQSMTQPHLIKHPLSSADMGILAHMDIYLRELSTKYSERPQSELISVIMPTFNRPETIKFAITSVLMQSYTNWELLVVDDGGKGAEIKFLLETINDPRIKYIRLDEHGGASRARNTGLRECNGTIIAYLDDDDQWDPDNLLVLYWEMKLAGARCGYGAQVVWDGFNESHFIGESFKVIRFAPFNRSLLENINYISMISFIHERSVIEQVGFFDESLKRYSDWDLFLRITEITRPVAVPCLLSHYYQGRCASSISAPADKTVQLSLVRERLEDRCKILSHNPDSINIKYRTFSISIKTDDARSSLRERVKNEFSRIYLHDYTDYLALEECLISLIANKQGIDYEIFIEEQGFPMSQLEGLRRHCLNKKREHSSECRGINFVRNINTNTIQNINDGLLCFMRDVICTTPFWLAELVLAFNSSSLIRMVVPRITTISYDKSNYIDVPFAKTDYECDITLSTRDGNVINPTFDTLNSLVELSTASMSCALVGIDSFKYWIMARNRFQELPLLDRVFCTRLRERSQSRIVYTPFSKVYRLPSKS